MFFIKYKYSLILLLLASTLPVLISVFVFKGVVFGPESVKFGSILAILLFVILFKKLN